ncbi:hypothetical protein Nepgr_031499 [Nepenthes gracilis]|uniref:Pentatricopeptide repeat-containing protein n=1 Tax=Nepenthes gracilis TaxID=150966 RepID=A0AAD3Y7K5_NEPGR|nr:hypothetical protein Nepgr_031499 [Nepenthes gracilis]
MVRAMITQNLNRVSEVPTIDLWNALIRKAVNDGYFYKTVSLYRQMKQNGVKPNKLTFPFVAKACAKLLDIRQSLIIHAHILKSPFSCNAFVGTAVIDMYVKCDYLECACNVFDKMPNRDVALWNVMLLGFAQSGSVDRFFCLFRQMRHEGMTPDSVSIIGLTQTVAELENAFW